MGDTYKLIISNTMDKINDYTGTWIVTFYQKLATGVLPVVGIAAAVMIALLAYKNHQNMSGEFAKEVMTKFIKLAIIVSLLKNWAMIDLLFVKTWVSMSESIASGIFGVASKSSGGIAAQIQLTFNQGFSTANEYIKSGGVTNFAPVIAGVIVMFFVLGTLTVLTLEIITAKLMMLIIIAMLPLFFLFLLFDSTKGVFDRVIGQLTGNALVVIFVSMAGAISISLLRQVVNSSLSTENFQSAASVILIGSVSFALIMKAARVAHGIGSSVCLASHGSGGMGEMRGHLGVIGRLAGSAAGPSGQSNSGAGKSATGISSNIQSNAASKFRGK